jgi:hypothetical protein
MKKSFYNYFVSLLVILAIVDLNAQISISTFNNFQDNTTQGWAMGAAAPAGAVTNITDLGPDGIGDNALQVISTGGGPGGKMVIENSNSEWVGDWTSTGSLYFNFSINNSSGADLNIRVALQDMSNNRICTTNGTTIPSNSGWHGYSIPMGVANFVLLGGGTISTILGAVTKIRIINNPTPSWVGINSTNTVLLDNISVSFSPLPVELTSFTAKYEDAKINLFWKTESEKNLYKFIVEQSNDGKKFDVIKELKSNGNAISSNNYKYSSSIYDYGINYYRLKMLDIDGHFNYSKIISIVVDSRLNDFSLYPNPVSNGIVFIKTNFENTNVKIYDLKGILNYDSDILNTLSFTKLDISSLPKGIYFVEILVENQKKLKKLVIL